MDKDTENQVTKMRRAIGDLFDCIIHLQTQIAEAAVLETAMISVLKNNVPGFEQELDKARAAAEKAVRENSRKSQEEVRQRLGKWIQ